MKKINKLKNENSLYLKQHADNPVHWYPWNDEAFEEAKKQSKPIMLSIGYSACHWCHVMAHESFEDQETADLLNENFISIKVDREERPDVDKIYQMSQSIITGKNGGWPLTIFMDHDKFPFFGGTYFPKVDKYGILSFKKILLRVVDFYRNNKADIKNQNANVLNVFNNLQSRETSELKINHHVLNRLKSQLESITDTINGGYGSAPKFPQFPSLMFSIDYCSSELEKKRITHTLDRMCMSGICDHVDGGFYRYSVDDLWMIPHFEKMLYDNGPMMSALCDSYIKFGDTFYLEKAKEIYSWIANFMTSKDGVFYSTIDADSEGVEGKYYTFTEDEINNSLEQNEIQLLNDYLLTMGRPNFEGNYHFHLHRKKENGFKENMKQFNMIFHKLRELRKSKILPGIDKKILLSWNCLYIKGLIKLYKITNDNNILNTINKSLDFIIKKMVSDKVIYSCFNDIACFPGYLDDYAMLGSTLIDYLSISWSIKHYNLCKRICNDLVTNFEDKKRGGFFFTSNDHEKLFYRPKSISDDSIPSGLVYATNTLFYMGYLSGNTEFIDVAQKSCQYISKSMDENLMSYVSAISLLNETKVKKKIIIVRASNSLWEKIKKRKEYYSNYIVFINSESNDLPEEIALKKPIGEFVSYHCEGMVCREPIESLDDFIKNINT